MDEMYFVETYEQYHTFVREEAYNWYMSSYEPGEVTVEDIYNFFEDDDMFVDEETANNDERTWAGYNVYSISQLCEDINNAIEEWAKMDV